MDFIRNMNNPARVQDYILAQRDRRAEDLARSLPHDMLLRIAYVPFVIARIAWDYVDTIVTTAAYLKIQQTKKLCRELRILRQQYDKTYRHHIDSAHVESEYFNASIVEDNVERIMQQLIVNISLEIKTAYPESEENYRLLYEAIQQCDILLKSLLIYTRRQTEKAEQLIKCEIGHILPEQIYEASRLIDKFLDSSHKVSDRFAELRKRYINTFANQFSMVEFKEESIKIIGK